VITPVLDEEDDIDCAGWSIAKTSSGMPMWQLRDLPGSCPMGTHLPREVRDPDYYARRVLRRGSSLS
jgi:hypothetical protein